MANLSNAPHIQPVRHKRTPRFMAIPLVVCIALLSLFVLPSSAFAAKVSDHPLAGSVSTVHSLSPQSVSVSQFAKKQSSSCILDVSLSPTSVSGIVGHTFNFAASWNCGPLGNLTITVNWGDGSNESMYTCYLNCFSGRTTFSHSFRQAGDFYMQAFGNQVPSYGSAGWAYIDYVA